MKGKSLLSHSLIVYFSEVATFEHFFFLPSPRHLPHIALLLFLLWQLPLPIPSISNFLSFFYVLRVIQLCLPFPPLPSPPLLFRKRLLAVFMIYPLELTPYCPKLKLGSSGKEKGGIGTLGQLICLQLICLPQVNI